MYISLFTYHVKEEISIITVNPTYVKFRYYEKATKICPIFQL